MNTWNNSSFTIANPCACNQKAPTQMSTEWGHLTANYTKLFNINNLKCLHGSSIKADETEQNPHWRKTSVSCSDGTSKSLFDCRVELLSTGMTLYHINTVCCGLPSTLLQEVFTTNYYWKRVNHHLLGGVRTINAGAMLQLITSVLRQSRHAILSAPTARWVSLTNVLNSPAVSRLNMAKAKWGKMSSSSIKENIIQLL